MKPMFYVRYIYYKIFRRGDKQIQCEGCCQYWFHINYANVSDENFNEVCDLGHNSHWFCLDLSARVQTPGELGNLTHVVTNC